MEHFPTAGGSVDFSMQRSVEIPQEPGLEVPCNPAVHLLCIFPEELKASYHSNKCAPICIAAQFVIGKPWKKLNVHHQRNG